MTAAAGIRVQHNHYLPYRDRAGALIAAGTFSGSTSLGVGRWREADLQALHQACQSLLTSRGQSRLHSKSASASGLLSNGRYDRAMAELAIPLERLDLEHPTVLRVRLRHIVEHADITGVDAFDRPVTTFEFACEEWRADRVAESLF